MFGLLSSARRSNNSKPLTIANKKKPKFKQGDLVTYEHIIGTNPIHKFMAIVDTVNDDNKYTIYVIDSAWDNPNKNHFENIAENLLEKITLDIDRQYNPDLWFKSLENSGKLSRIKQIVAYKQYIKALKLNIDFIESRPNTFSDFALPEKKNELEIKKAELQQLINQPNVIEPHYLQYEHVVYGNIIAQISAICDTFTLSVPQKEKIIRSVIKTYDILIGFAGTTFSIDLIFYKLYGYSLIVELCTSLPDLIKQKILELLYITIIAHFNFIYEACNAPANTLDRIKEFAELLYKVFFKIAGPILLPGASAILPPTDTDTKMECNNPDLSDPKNSFGLRVGSQFIREVVIHDLQSKINFTWLNTGKIISFTPDEIEKIERNFNKEISTYILPKKIKLIKTLNARTTRKTITNTHKRPTLRRLRRDRSIRHKSAIKKNRHVKDIRTVKKQIGSPNEE